MFKLKLENESANIVDINDGEHYAVLSVSGLNPPPASIFTAKSPNRKGSKYNGSTLNERNIVVEVKILGNIEENRNALYAWIDTEQYCKVHYRNGLKNVYCEGHVQDCEIDYFSDNEIISLAILCENPYWKDLQTISADVSALLMQFTFPFAIAHEAVVERATTNRDGSPAVTYMNKGVPFSTIRDTNVTSIFNSGAETGMQIIVNCKDAVGSFEFFSADDTTQRFKINTPLEAGWVVVIDTEASPKTCKLLKPDGSTESIIKYIGANPTWFSLKKGFNRFAYTTGSGDSAVAISLNFTTKYLGV